MTLAAGEYHFQSLSFGAKTEVEILGPVVLHVVEGLRFGSSVTQQLSAGVNPNEIVYRRIGMANDPCTSGSGSDTLRNLLCAVVDYQNRQQ